MHRLIIVGSPRAHGRSAALAAELFDACIDECPEDGLSILSVSSLHVSGCLGCDACRNTSQVPEFDPEAPLPPCARVRKSDALQHQCVITDDDMAEVREHLDACHELNLVVPVYFASVPSQFKAWLDRLQPYFWSNLRRKKPRPCIVHIVGEGNDPFGFDPLITTLQSSLYCAGFSIERVLDWVGKIDSDGTILEDADEYLVETDKSTSELGAETENESSHA